MSGRLLLDDARALIRTLLNSPRLCARAAMTLLESSDINFLNGSPEHVATDEKRLQNGHGVMAV